MVTRCLAVLFCGTVLPAFAKDNIRDLSSRPPFNAYVGHTVRLLRSASLVYEDFWTGPEYGIASGRNIGSVSSDGIHWHPAAKYHLPVGHRIHVDTVEKNPAFSPYLLARGHTFVPALGKQVSIHFYWAGPGIGAGEYAIGRAPWEPKSVPEIRTSHDPTFLQ
jgi:hypothetical protein